MRQLADAVLVATFLRELGAAATAPSRIYFTGGVTAVLLGWRKSTIDLDVKLVPDSDRLLRAIAVLKERLAVNVELACPSDFVPELPGWQDRSLFIGREGRLDAFHFDPYSQALAKIERGHDRDRDDVAQLLRRGLVQPGQLREHFARMRPALYRYPAIDPGAFERAVGEALASSA